MAIGGVVTLVPAVAGIVVLLDPLQHPAAAGGAVKVTTLEALPKDGVPRMFRVLANRSDAWNQFTNVPVGSVYLRRTAEDKIEALNATCPHAGCMVDYAAGKNKFLCPCHDSSFHVDGKIDNPASPSPRALDSLEVQLRKDGEVWVVFQNYQAGRPDKVAQT